jgi:hypothetical protein
MRTFTFETTIESNLGVFKNTPWHRTKTETVTYAISFEYDYIQSKSYELNEPHDSDELDIIDVWVENQNISDDIDLVTRLVTKFKDGMVNNALLEIEDAQYNYDEE